MPNSNQTTSELPSCTTDCPQCAEWRQQADDVINTLKITREKYGIGDRHVMREKNQEIARLRKALESANNERCSRQTQNAENKGLRPKTCCADREADKSGNRDQKGERRVAPGEARLPRSFVERMEIKATQFWHHAHCRAEKAWFQWTRRAHEREAAAWDLVRVMAANLLEPKPDSAQVASSPKETHTAPNFATSDQPPSLDDTSSES